MSEQDRYDEAIALLQQEISTGKASPNSYAQLGCFLSDVKADLAGAEKVSLEALMRYPQHPTLVNNLAYIFLMQGHPAKAREVLSSFKINDQEIHAANRAALTATCGLLHLWEGDLTTGEQRYKEAEGIAHESGQNTLPNVVRQKMHLELARALLRQHDIQAAMIEIRKGLSERSGRSFYERDLRLLNAELEEVK